MKKAVLVLILLCVSAIVCSPVFSLAPGDYEPYKEGEFPKWALDLRRAETIFFGGIPITYTVTALALSLANRPTDFWPTIAYACSFSAVIAVIDYILGIGK